MRKWLVGLDAWIIQDGNYGDFHVGQEAQFALEFTAGGQVEAAANAEPSAEPRAIRWSSDLPPSGSRTGDGAWVLDDLPIYDFVATIVRREPWIIDFGLRAYCTTSRLPRTDISMVAFSGHLGVDPFTYFEGFAQDDSIPPLIYSWRIDRIGRQTAPWIEQQPGYFVRDQTQRAFAEVQETNAWEDDGGHAAYVLECTLIDPEPRRRSETAAYP